MKLNFILIESLSSKNPPNFTAQILVSQYEIDIQKLKVNIAVTYLTGFC
jgi:hypothetical protein